MKGILICLATVGFACIILSCDNKESVVEEKFRAHVAEKSKFKPANLSLDFELSRLFLYVNE